MGRLHFSLPHDRTEADCRLDQQPGRDSGDHRVEHSRLSGDLGERIDAGHDAGLRDAWLGLAASSKVAETACGDWLDGTLTANGRRHRAAIGDKVMRQGEVASHGKSDGSAYGGVNAPEALILPDPARRFTD